MKKVKILTHSITGSVTLTFKMVTLTPQGLLPLPVSEVSSLCDNWLLRYKEMSEKQLFDLGEVI